MYKVATPYFFYNVLSKKNVRYLIFSIFSFFIGRGVVLTFISPFAIPFLSLFLGQAFLKFFVIYFFVVLGLYQSFSGIFFYTYFLGATILLFANYLVVKNNSMENFLTKNKLSKGIISSVTIFLSGLITIISYDNSFYFTVTFLLLSCYYFILPTILSKGFDIFTFKGPIKALNNEEMISLCCLLGGLVLGVNGLSFYYVDLTSCILFTCILIISYSNGSSSAVTAAIILSFFSYFNGNISSETVLCFAIVGIFSGLSQSINKLYNILGSILSLLLIYFYINTSLLSITFLFSYALAASVFYVLPSKFYLILHSTFGQVIEDEKGYGEKIKYYTSSKLNSYSRSFNKLSKTFKNLAVTKDRLNQEDIGDLINQVVNSSCNNCENKKYCWQTIFYTTYKQTTRIIESIEDGDREKIETSVASFDKVCLNTQLFIDNINVYYGFFKSNMVWHNKISENKSLIADQLFDISNIFSNIVMELNNKILFLPKIENIIIKSLESNNISPFSVLALKNEKGIYNIWITLEILIKEKDAFTVIKKVVSSAIGNKVKILKYEISHDGKYEIFLEEVYKYKIMFGVSMTKKENSNVSGDSYSTLNLPSGETMLAISDGMGSGKAASVDSSAAIDLFEEFIEAGFDKKLAIKLINSSLILKSSADSFTTLDACIIDLHKGYGQFIKIGASPSFIIRGTQVMKITSSSLPIGIINNIDTEIITKSLKDGDIIVMMSDGILEVIHSYEEQEKWITSVLKSFKGKNPKDIAYNIVKEATKMAKGAAKDDMTVVVGKIIKKAS